MRHSGKIRGVPDWWTGKDSNLRSPQGAADLQSAGFSHSPTRPAKTFDTRTTNLSLVLQQLAGVSRKNTKRTRVKRHQPVHFYFQDSLRLAPLQNSRWSWRRELNPRPSDYKSDALPAELRQRRSNQVRIAEGESELQGVVPGLEHVNDQLCGNLLGPFPPRHQLSCFLSIIYHISAKIETSFYEGARFSQLLVAPGC